MHPKTYGKTNLDQIAFVSQDDVSCPESRRLQILVNGTPLEDLARRIELPFAAGEGTPQIAGKYVGLSLKDVGPPSRVLLGDAAGTIFKYGDRTQVLGCDCGEPGCWPLVCRIRVLADAVEWSDFSQPHRADSKGCKVWSHKGLGPFVFDRTSYESAFAAIRNAGSG
jgi:hypothetical protein